MIQGIGQARVDIVLQSEDYGIRLSLVKTLIDVVLKYHCLRSLSLYTFIMVYVAHVHQYEIRAICTIILSIHVSCGQRASFKSF